MPTGASNTSNTPDFETQDGTINVDVSPSKLSDWLIGRGRHFISAVECWHVLVNADIEQGLWLAVEQGGATREQIAACFGPDRPDGWTQARALDNLAAKLEHLDFSTNHYKLSTN